MSDQFPGEINNRCKVLFPVLKQQRQKGKWAPFVMMSFTSTDSWSHHHGSSEWKHRIMSLSFPQSPSLISVSPIRTHHFLSHTDALCNICPVCFSVIRFGGLLHLCLISTPIFTTQLPTAQWHEQHFHMCSETSRYTDTHPDQTLHKHTRQNSLS